MQMNRKIGYTLTLGAVVTAGALAGCEKKDEGGGYQSAPATTGTPATTGRSTTTGTSTTSPSAQGAAGAAAPGTAAAAAPNAAKEATAVIEPSKAPGQDNVAGTVHFTSTGTGVKVRAEVTGLSPNGTHGFHIHEKGDLSAPDLASAGAHFNPDGHKHGGAEGAERHGGDLGNLKADADGKATLELIVEGLTIDDPKTGVISRSVIVHEKADDLKTDPSGNSGARIAGGVVKAGK
jgi:Cu-Zn family superoxide dismutase